MIGEERKRLDYEITTCLNVENLGSLPPLGILSFWPIPKQSYSSLSDSFLNSAIFLNC
jgi:hypothetical protein